MPRPAWDDTNDLRSLLQRVLAGVDENGNAYSLPTNTVEEQVRGGRVFTAGSGKLEAAVAGFINMTLANPVGSGKTLYLYRVVSFANERGYAKMLVNPTTNLPTTAKSVNNANFGSGNTGVAELKADVDGSAAMSGGIDSGIVVGVPTSIRSIIDLPPFIVPPGVTLGLTADFIGAFTGTINALWWEE